MDLDDCFEGYEPDAEDIAWELERERDFEQCESYIREAKRQLYDCDKFTSKRVYELSREIKRLSRELWNEYQYDIERECFEVWNPDIDDSMTLSRDYKLLEPALTRTDKRRMRKDRRNRSRQLGILTKRGCSPRQVTGHEDVSFTAVVPAM